MLQLENNWHRLSQKMKWLTVCELEFRRRFEVCHDVTSPQAYYLFAASALVSPVAPPVAPPVAISLSGLGTDGVAVMGGRQPGQD